MAVNRYYSSTAVATALTTSITNAATSIVVGATTGFPLSFPYTLAIEPDTSNMELVTVTAASSTTLTVTRGVDGTAAISHLTGAVVIHDVSARDYAEPQAHLAATSGVHGVTGNLVGVTDTQTLTNKTLTTPTIAQLKPDGTHTLTMPARTDTLVGRTTIDTLSNKTLDASTSIDGVSGARVAALDAAQAAMGTPTTGTASGVVTGSLATVGSTPSLAAGTWLVLVTGSFGNTSGSAMTVHAAVALGTATGSVTSPSPGNLTAQAASVQPFAICAVAVLTGGGTLTIQGSSALPGANMTGNYVALKIA